MYNQICTLIMGFKSCKLIFGAYSDQSIQFMYVMLAHVLAHLLGFEVSLSLFLMCGSCHVDRSLNVEIGVEYLLIFVVLFL